MNARATTYVAAAFVMLTASTAMAGIDFASMPVGCNWVTKYSNGNTWRETFKGRKGDHYVTQTLDTLHNNAVVSTKKFNMNGDMVERIWGDGRWERFEPFSCFGVTVTCSYTYSNADGDSLSIVNKTRKNGKGFLVKARVKGGEKYPDEVYEVGHFGLAVSNRSSNYAAATGAFRNCGLESS